MRPGPPSTSYCSTKGVAPVHTAPPVLVHCATSAGAEINLRPLCMAPNGLRYSEMGPRLSAVCKGQDAQDSQLQPIQVPKRKFAHVHVDLVGPFPTSSEGYTHIFIILDRTTRWAEAVPVSCTSVRDCTKAFFRGWVSCFGVPDRVNLR
jgi:hypothetical protein